MKINCIVLLSCSIIYRFVLPLNKKGDLLVPSKPILESGLVFHIYSDNNCQGKDKYMNQLEFNIDLVLKQDPSVMSIYGLIIGEHSIDDQL